MTRPRIRYSDYRCGLTFVAVRRELQGEQTARAAQGDHMYVTRKTVLGRMRQLKQAAYEYQFGAIAAIELTT